MKIDLYTKTLLTVIAAALVWICARDLPLVAYARAGDSDVQKVSIVDVDLDYSEQPVPVEITRLSYGVNPLPVKMKK